MSWFKSRADKLEEEVWRLKDALSHSNFEVMRLREALSDARVSGAKIRSRARGLREERRRLRSLLTQHNIPWERRSPDGSTSTET